MADTPTPADMPKVARPEPYPDVSYAELAEIAQLVEAEADEIADPRAEDALSVNEWLGRIQGAGTEAQQMARAGELVLEERAWIALAAIATRRVTAIRRLGR